MNEALRAEMIKRAQEAREAYKKLERKYSKMLILGDTGTGKTSLAITCPKPVYIDSFDPGGTKTKELQPLIQKGDIIADASFEDDTWKRPHAYRDWEASFQKKKRDGFFDFIGTYILDSATKWTDSVLFAVMQRAGRPGQPSQIQDYNIQQLTIIDHIGEMASLPCHVIVTGHFGYWKDEVTGAIEAGMLVAGKLSDKVPLCFDEKYIMRVVRDPKSATTKHMLQMKTEGRYVAATRLGGRDTFNTFEEPDIREILKRGDMYYEDKPPLY